MARICEERKDVGKDGRKAAYALRPALAEHEPFKAAEITDDQLGLLRLFGARGRYEGSSYEDGFLSATDGVVAIRLHDLEGEDVPSKTPSMAHLFEEAFETHRVSLRMKTSDLTWLNATRTKQRTFDLCASEGELRLMAWSEGGTARAMRFAIPMPEPLHIRLDGHRLREALLMFDLPASVDVFLSERLKPVLFRQYDAAEEVIAELLIMPKRID